MIKIVVMCCVLNEERNIERYCEVYSRFTDKIVICDGGSTDRTVELAEGFPKVNVVHFGELKDFNGIPCNPLGPMHNFAYRAVLEKSPDWIITDEADSLPTLELQRTARSIMILTAQDIVGAGRIYMIGKDDYFPALSMQGYFGWAHQPREVDGRYGETKFAGIPRPYFPHPEGAFAARWRKLDQPLALLHDGWPNEEVVNFKTRRYRLNGALREGGTAIPAYAGQSEPLPGWAKWN